MENMTDKQFNIGFIAVGLIIILIFGLAVHFQEADKNKFEPQGNDLCVIYTPSKTFSGVRYENIELNNEETRISFIYMNKNVVSSHYTIACNSK